MCLAIEETAQIEPIGDQSELVCFDRFVPDSVTLRSTANRFTSHEPPRTAVCAAKASRPNGLLNSRHSQYNSANVE